MMPRSLVLALLLALVPWSVPRAGAPTPGAARPPAAATPDIPYTMFKLVNGLTVVVHEDHTNPIVGVHVQYDVGAKDEKPGRTGFAHLFEHLMFQGSEHLPKGIGDRLVESDGGDANGSTSQDTTQYWEQVPANAF